MTGGSVARHAVFRVQRHARHLHPVLADEGQPGQLDADDHKVQRSVYLLGWSREAACREVGNYKSNRSDEAVEGGFFVRRTGVKKLTALPSTGHLLYIVHLR